MRELPQADRTRAAPCDAAQGALHRLRQGRTRSATLTARGTGIALGVAAGVVAADQLTKAWVLRHLSVGPHHLFGPLGVELTRNSGVAFSALSGHSAVAVVVTFALTAVVAVCAARSLPVVPAIVFGLLLGGAIGNDVDRIARRHTGGVVDFITLPHWPAFNVADSAITVGVVGLVSLVVLRRRLFAKGS